MTPRRFAALAAVAVVSAVAAIAVYSSSVEWSSGSPGGTPLFADLGAKLPEVAKLEVSQGGKSITLARDGKDWTLVEHDSFPAAPEKVQALLAGMSRARLVEAKTQKVDRYPLLGVEDPAGKDAKSRLVRLLDGQGKTLAEIIVGNKRYDAFGTGQSGTYVRAPNDQQAWLADAELDGGVELTDWVNSQLFETQGEDVKHLTVSMPGEEPLEIVPSPDRHGHTLAQIPDGMKLKYINVVDEVVRAASEVDFSEVRKSPAAADDKDVSTVVMDLDGGLKTTLRIRQEGDDAWLTLEASGEGQTQKVADDLNARAKGWEFRIPLSRAKEILKRREDLLEKVSS
jgi:hypothetical protein